MQQDTFCELAEGKQLFRFTLFINIPEAERKMNNQQMDVTSRQCVSKNKSRKEQTSILRLALDVSVQ
jgi:hypothetical protein